MAWIAPLASVALSYMAQRKAAKGTPLQNQLQQLNLSNLQQTSPMGLDMLRSAGSNLGHASDFWGGILRGTSGGAAGLLAPALSNLDRQSQAALQSRMRTIPRGGGSAEANRASMDANSANRTNALLALQPQAAQQLAGIGSQQGSLGGGLLSGAINGGNSMSSNLQMQQNSLFDQSKETGKGIYQLMQLLGPYLEGKFGSTGTTTTPTNASAGILASTKPLNNNNNGQLSVFGGSSGQNWFAGH